MDLCHYDVIYESSGQHPKQLFPMAQLWRSLPQSTAAYLVDRGRQAPRIKSSLPGRQSTTSLPVYQSTTVYLVP